MARFDVVVVIIICVVAVIFFVRFCFLSIFVRFVGNFVRSNVSSPTKKTGRKCTTTRERKNWGTRIELPQTRRVHFIQIEFGVRGGGKGEIEQKSNEKNHPATTLLSIIILIIDSIVIVLTITITITIITYYYYYYYYHHTTTIIIIIIIILS
jgi:hypothetical protein